jgi:hypothetical protein
LPALDLARDKIKQNKRKEGKRKEIKKKKREYDFSSTARSYFHLRHHWYSPTSLDHGIFIFRQFGFSFQAVF